MPSGGNFFTDEEIRDTTAVDSPVISELSVADVLVVAENTHNQIVAVQYQGSMNGTVWHDLGVSVNVPAIVGEAPGKNAQIITDPWPKLRCRATAASNPASGSLNVYWIKKREGLT